MEFREYLPFWKELTSQQQAKLESSATLEHVKKGEVIHNGTADCVGLLVLVSGQLRGFSLSEDGRQVTLYRLFSRDVCLMSAYCMLNSLQFDISVQAEQDTVFWRIPAPVYKELMRQSAPVANFTTELIASRFSDVMWLLDQILYKHLDSRLAAFLVEESRLTGSDTLALTHDAIAQHLGSAREVITRMLRYFSSEGLVKLGRGSLQVLDEARLVDIAGDSLR